MSDRASLYEYSLYASIILLSGMGVASLPSYLDETPVSPVNAYTAAMYLAFLGWAFHQLHKIHCKKTPGRVQPRPSLVVDNGSVPERMLHSQDPERSWMNGLTLAQRSIVRLMVALGGEVKSIERAGQVQEPQIEREAKEKPEAA